MTTFLAGLVARAGPLAPTSLRPDPWRGRPALDTLPDAGAMPEELSGETGAAGRPTARDAGPLSAPPVAISPAPPRAPDLGRHGPAETPAVVSRVSVGRAIVHSTEASPGERQPAAMPMLPRALLTPRARDSIAATTLAAPPQHDRTEPWPDAQARPQSVPRPLPAPDASLRPRLHQTIAPDRSAAGATEGTAIEISIGRIEWRAAPPPPVTTPPTAAAPEMRFADYRALRMGLDRGRR